MLKKFAGISLVAVFLFLAAAPETYGHNRGRRGKRAAVAGRTYYNPYYANANRGRFNERFSDRRYFGRRYSGERNRRGIGSTGRAVLTVAAPAAIAAGVGAIVGGKKGAVVGALLGGGGGAAYYLLKNRRRR
jgi:hypothetical protein